MTTPDVLITSPANPRLKQLLQLRRRRVRDASGLTLVEGFEELTLAVAGGAVPKALYVCPDLFSPSGYAGPSRELVAEARAAGAQIVQLRRGAFEKVAYREGPDGLLGVVALGDRDLDQLVLPERPLVLVAEGVEKPGNLGAMLRTADATGTDAVVAVEPATDWGNPNVIRASKGTVFTVPIATTDVGRTVAWCRSRGIRLVVTTPHAGLVYTDADYLGPVAVIVGAEKHGVSEGLRSASDVHVRIPMAGRADSLNVSTAAAVVLYEAVRQRGSKRLHT